MRKITLLLAIACISLVTRVQAVENWSRTVAGTNAPEGLGGARNMAAGVFNGNDRVFLPETGAAATINIFDAGTGAFISTLNSTGVTLTGTFKLCDGDVTEDGKLLLGNVARKVSETFQVYKWENETDAPELVVSYVPTAGTRYGDRLTITGNYTTGTAKIYATNRAVGNHPIMCWSMEEAPVGSGTYKFKNTPDPVQYVQSGVADCPSVCPIPDGGFYYKEGVEHMIRYDALGDSTMSTSANETRYGTAVKYLCKDGNDDIIAYSRYRATAEKPLAAGVAEYVDILRVPNGNMSAASVIASTPSLGTAFNLNGYVDIVVRKVGDDAEVFYYSSPNGLAKHTLKNFLTPEPEPNPYPGFEPNAVIDWQQSEAGENMPVISGGINPLASGRNIAAGNFNGNDRFIVFTRTPGISVYVYEAATGNYVGVLDGTGVAGGVITIGDGELTEDGKLLMSNVARNSETFKVYKWDNETSAPTTVITYPMSGSKRFGDHLFITGNYSTGTAKVYATNKAGGSSPVLCWSMEEVTSAPGTYEFNNTPEELFEVFGLDTMSAVCVIPGEEGNVDGYYYKESGMPIAKYNATGDSISQDSISRTFGGTTVKYIGKHENADIIAYYRYRDISKTPSDFPQEYADILRVPDGDLSQATVIGRTPSLGAAQNLNGWGDIVARRSGSDVELFVFSATNGFGKFTVEGVFLTISTNQVEQGVKFISKQGMLSIEGPAVASIEIYNTLGQRVSSANNTNEVNTGNLSGVHVVKVKFNNLTIQTAKVIL